MMKNIELLTIHHQKLKVPLLENTTKQKKLSLRFHINHPRNLRSRTKELAAQAICFDNLFFILIVIHINHILIKLYYIKYLI